MGSSGGGGGGAGMMALMNQGKPMPGLPVAGAGASIDPYEYGKFQNFLPEIKAEGQNDMATGLRPDMFKYRSPSGVVAEGGGGGAGGGDQTQVLRDVLAQLQAGGGGGGNPPYGYNPFDSTSPGYSGQGWGGGGGGGGGGGAPGTMGLGGGGMPNEPPMYGFNGSTERMPTFWGTGVRYAAQPPSSGNVLPNNPFPPGTPGM